jgi:glycosyltransferase involved in cell wall biosynthesis
VRIALIHPRLLYKGGLETRLWSYMANLQARGHEVTVIVFKVGEGIQVPDGIRLQKVNIDWVPKLFRAWVFDRRVGRIMEQENFDFSLSLGRTSHQDALLLPGNHLGYLRAMGKRGRSLDDRLQIFMDAKGYASAGTILACSEMMRDEVVELYGVNAQKIKVLYPPTDIARFHLGHRENRGALRKQFGMDPGKVSFVLVSASHGRKGLPLLLKVFEALKNEPFELFVAGEEPVNVSGLANVKALGFVKDTEGLYSAADFTLLPALYEPFGQVVSESLLCGTPVILSKHVGAKSIVDLNSGLVLPDLEVGTWVDAIRSLSGRKFQIPKDLATRYGLDIESHMERILGLTSMDL